MDHCCCTHCGLSFDISTNTHLPGKQHFSVFVCPNCKTRYDQCLYCDTRYKNRYKKKDFRSIQKHINQIHSNLLGTQALDEGGADQLPHDSEGYENEAVLEEPLLNLGVETETDYLGYNNDADDALVENLLEMSEIESQAPQDNINDYTPPQEGYVSIQLESFKPFSNDKSNVYFWQDYICNQEDEICGGFRGIVWRSVLKRQLYDSSKISTLDDAQLMLNMTQHTKNNTQEQNDIFFDIMQDIHHRTSGEDFSAIIPTDHQSSQEMLMEGKFGIFGNLPHEEVFELEGHACVSLIGLLMHILAHGIPIGFTEQTDMEGDTRDRFNTNGCPAMEELLKCMKDDNPDNKPTKYGSYILWSDGFVRSFVKQKGNSVWILTITFTDPDGCATSKFHTYCLAIGKSSNDHEPVIDHYLQEIETLAKGVEVFSAGKFIRVQMGLLAYIADRPERHAILNQTQGGIFGKRTLWSAFIDCKHLPFCDRCFDKEIQNLLNKGNHGDSGFQLPRCGRCCQWDMLSPSPSNNKMKASEIKKTKNYPTTFDPGGPLHPHDRGVPICYLKPVQLDFEWMLCVLRYAAHNVLHGNWNKGQTQSYAQSCAIPDRVTDKMYDRFHAMDIADDTNGDAVKSNEYIPKVWLSTVAMSAWIDAGMHHIFHGVVARIMLAMEDVFTDEDRKTPFENLVNPYLQDIVHLRLDWMHVKELPKTQWLAEDELGFSRIMAFVYGQFFLNMTLRETSNTTESALLAMRQMLVSLQVMIALLMSPTDPDVNVIDRHVKLFLSCCHRFCQVYYDEDHTPFWAATSNFPSLLNLAQQIKKYGPIRWYWEGTRERYIQTVKKVLVSMRKSTSYFARKMVIMQKLGTMAWLNEKLRRKMGREKRDYSRMCFRYENIHEVRHKYKNGVVMSGLTTKLDDGTTLAGHFWIVYGKRGSKNLTIVPIVMDREEETSKVLCGMNYHKYSLDEDNCVGGLSRQDLKNGTSDYCVLLPYKENKKDFELLYGIVFSDWETIDSMGNKNLPVLCETEFAEDVKSMNS